MFTLARIAMAQSTSYGCVRTGSITTVGGVNAVKLGNKFTNIFFPFSRQCFTIQVEHLP